MPVQTLTRLPTIKTPGNGPVGPGPFDFPNRQALALGQTGFYGPPIPPDPRTAVTIRYVRKTGSDSNGGTSPADAWATITHALVSIPDGTSPTVVYVGAGTYREGGCNVGKSPTPQNPLWIIGDVDGVQTGDVGAVILSNFTTNDLTAAVNAAALDMGGHSNIIVQNMVLVSGGQEAFKFNTGQNIWLRDCACLASGSVAAAITGGNGIAGVPSNHVIDRCLILNLSGNGGYSYTATRAAVDFDYQVWVVNSIFNDYGGSTAAVFATIGGTLAGKPGGVRILNCTILSQRAAIATTDANLSTSIPTIQVQGCIIVSGNGAALSANTSRQIVEDYNVVCAPTPRTNVTAGQHSQTVKAALTLHMGQERIWGGQPRPFGEPMAGSAFLGFGAGNVLAGLLDAYGRPRLQGAAQWAVGALQRGNAFTESTAISEDGDGYSIALVGAGSHDFDIPADAGPATVAVWVQYDSNYTGPLPELWVLPNGEMGLGSSGAPLGLPARAVALPGLAGTWQQLSCPINPTSFGILPVRVLSSDTSGIAVATFDAFTVT